MHKYIRLTFQDPTVADGGTYKCHVKNTHGENHANLNLNIEGEKRPEGEPPTFVEKPTIIPEDGGKKITMECKVRAKPKPDFKWTVDGVEIKESSQISITIVEETKEVYVIRLVIKVIICYFLYFYALLKCLFLQNATPANGGLYKCNIKNEIGETNANLTLNIEGKYCTFCG